MVRNKFKIQFFSLVLLLPIVHVIANITTNYFPSGTLNPGTIRLIFMVAVIFLYFKFYKPPYRQLFILVSIYLLYNLVLVLLNDDLVSPIINYIKLTLPFFMFFIGYSVIKDASQLSALFKSFLIATFFFILNYIIANIFGLGGSAYLEDSFNIGGAGVGSANEMAVFMLVAIAFLLLNNNKKWKWFTILLIVGGSIVILLSLRRGAFLTLGGALAIFIYVNGLNTKIAKYFAISVFFLTISFPFYGNTFIERYEYRVESRDGSLANLEVEGRYLELQKVPVALSQENRWLIGTHNLNSADYFGYRELHVGYMAILHGSGLIGLLFFIGIIFFFYKRGSFIFKKSVKFDRLLNRNNRILYSLYLSLIVALLIYLLTSRLHGFSVSVPSFLMMGSILGYLRSQ